MGFREWPMVSRARDGTSNLMTLLYYFIGSMIAAFLGLELTKVVTAPFFTVKSLFTSKRQSS